MPVPYKILIIAPAWIGDMVMAQSLFKLLKIRYPSVQIDVLAPAWTFSLLQCMPEVSEAIEMPIQHGELKLGERLAIGKQLREKNYDQAIVLPNSFKSALIPWFAHIQKRTGWLGEQRYFLLNDYRKLDKKRLPRMVEQYVALGLSPDEPMPESHPYPAFHVSAAAQESVIAKFLSAKPARPVLGLGIGAAFGSSKRWPERYYAQIAQQKLAEGWDVWLFGSAADRELTNCIQRETNHECLDLSGRTELQETIALLSLVTGVVTNDSGLMHMAAALQKPLVALYGSTSPEFTPPLSQYAQILSLNLACQPCFKRECPLKHHRCMQDLLPTNVLTAINAWGR